MLRTDYQKLVRRAMAGDKAAFNLLFRAYQPRVTRFLTSHLGDYELARELVQETMVRAFFSLTLLKDPGKFDSWLFGIAANVRRDLQRRIQATDGLPPDPRQGIDPVTVLETQEERRLIRRSLLALPQDCRVILDLYYYEQYSLKEIGGILEITHGAAKVRLFRARRLLRDHLHPHSLSPNIIDLRKTKTMSIKANIIGVYSADRAQPVSPYLLLGDEERRKCLRIGITGESASLISSSLKNSAPNGTLALDLTIALLAVTEAEILEIRIRHLNNDAYLGTIMISVGGNPKSVDASLTDAIRLSLRLSASLMIDHEDWERAATNLGEDAPFFQYGDRNICTGDLKISDQGWGFLTQHQTLNGDVNTSLPEIYVSPQVVQRLGLKNGDQVTGVVRPPTEDELFYGLLGKEIQAINGHTLQSV